MSFSELEKCKIREALLRAGARSFARFGLKRTRVEDLTRAAGIAKGSFYAFFPSKEALCFAVLEEEERQRDLLLAEKIRTVRDYEELAEVMSEAFDAFERSAVAMRLYELDEFQALIRRIPPEEIARHQNQDRHRMESIIGPIAGTEPAVTAGLFRAILMLSLQRNAIGEEVFPQVRTLLIRSVCRELWREKT